MRQWRMYSDRDVSKKINYLNYCALPEPTSPVTSLHLTANVMGNRTTRGSPFKSIQSSRTWSVVADRQLGTIVGTDFTRHNEQNWLMLWWVNQLLLKILQGQAIRDRWSRSFEIRFQLQLSIFVLFWKHQWDRRWRRRWGRRFAQSRSSDGEIPIEASTKPAVSSEQVLSMISNLAQYSEDTGYNPELYTEYNRYISTLMTGPRAMPRQLTVTRPSLRKRKKMRRRRRRSRLRSGDGATVQVTRGISNVKQFCSIKWGH